MANGNFSWCPLAPLISKFLLTWLGKLIFRAFETTRSNFDSAVGCHCSHAWLMKAAASMKRAR
ncbi:hypothetical protein D3C84_1166790 [compost metagenome]